MSDGMGFLKGFFSADETMVDTSELRIRLVNGALSQSTAQLSLRRSFGLDVGALWRGRHTFQPTAHAWWKALVYWTMANGMLYGSSGLDVDKRRLSLSTYQLCKELIDEAERLSEAALKSQVMCESAKDQPEPSILAMPTIPVGQETYEGAWSVLYELCNLFDADLDQLRTAPKPKRFDEVQEKLEELTVTAQSMVHQYQLEWVSADTMNEKIVVIEKTLPYVGELFLAIQQWWAPALLGRIYARSLRGPTELDDLAIPFSPWILTDPWQLAKRRHDNVSSHELAAFWNAFPDPGLALRLQGQLNHANGRGDIRRYGVYPESAPWPSQYLVRWPVQFGHRNFEPGDLICLYFDTRTNRLPAEIRGDGHVDDLSKLLGCTR